MTSRPEYVWDVSSDNRICSPSNTDPVQALVNPTNNITIPTSMPRLRTPTVLISLGSMELPLAQYLIEYLWNTLYFDEGVRLIVNNDSELCTREFSVNLNGTVITAILPILFNPIIDVDLTDPNNPIFTTQFDHALDLRDQWNWGAPIELISTNLTDPALTQFTANNPNLVILGPNEFQLLNAPGAYPSSGGIFGYVHAPPIASPAYLAQIVNAALNLVAPGQFIVTYNSNGRFTFQSAITQSGTCVSNPPLSNENITLLIPTRNCLAALMGFGCGNVPVPTVPSVTDVVDCKVPVPCNPPTLEGGFGYQCFSQIAITPGNYTANTLIDQLNLQFNRFFFDGGLTNAAADRPIFVFSDPAGIGHQIPIEFGQYTPDTFAEYLQQQMNIADPTNNYIVSWDITTGLFCFQGTSNFGLEFNDSTQTLNPAVLGYDAISYRGQNQYCSTTPFQVPTSTCCGTQQSRFSSYIFNTQASFSNAKFTIEVNPPRCVSVAGFTDIGGGIGELYTDLPAPGPLLAGGLQPEDTVNITLAGVTYSLRVVEVVNAFRVRVEIAGVSALVGLVNAAVSFCYGDLVVSSLLFADQQKKNRLPPRMLGYGNQDALYSGSPPVFISPFSYDLDYPRYVLLVITDPEGSTHQSHQSGQSVIPNVFAKILIFPQLRVERNYQMLLYLSEVKQVTHATFVFLNPDHTPFQMHGKNWSCTLTLVVAESQLELKCF